jgi:hypothetical protein
MGKWSKSEPDKRAINHPYNLNKNADVGTTHL